jgi:hypothetical protein
VSAEPDLELLALIVRLAPTSEQWTDTEAVARSEYERQQAQRGPAFFNGTPPWCGLREPLEDLERAGFIDVTPEVAEFHLPGGPTPVGGKHPFGIVVTEAGFAEIGEYRHYLFSIDEAGGELMVGAGTIIRHDKRIWRIKARRGGPSVTRIVADPLDDPTPAEVAAADAHPHSEPA